MNAVLLIVGLAGVAAAVVFGVVAMWTFKTMSKDVYVSDEKKVK